MGDLFPIFFFRILTFDIRSLIRNLIFFINSNIIENFKIISKR